MFVPSFHETWTGPPTFLMLVCTQGTSPLVSSSPFVCFTPTGVHYLFSFLPPVPPSGLYLHGLPRRSHRRTVGGDLRNRVLNGPEQRQREGSETRGVLVPDHRVVGGRHPVTALVYKTLVNTHLLVHVSLLGLAGSLPVVPVLTPALCRSGGFHSHTSTCLRSGRVPSVLSHSPT